MAEEGGYPYETVLPLSPDYQCPICQDILCEPQQIATCGHRFCQKCLEPILRNNPPLCPLDRQKIVVDRVFSDVGHKRTILGLQVKCLNSSKGCKWTGELSDAQTHRDKCPLEKVKCVNCEEMIERRNEQRHRQEECVWRKMTCQHCNEDYAFCQKQDHMDNCKLLPIDCLNGCEILIPKMKMTSHINEECPLTIVECPYSATGCKVTEIKRCKLKAHLAQSTQSHLIVTLERQQRMDQEMEQLRNEIGNLKGRIIEQERHQQEMKDLKKRLNKQEKQLQEEKKRLNEQLCNFERKFLRSDCVLIWRIENCEQCLSVAQASSKERILSHPFYSGRYGYKLRCHVSVSGSDGNESYLSLFIHILKGEFDALLPWPFFGKVTFTLINQTKEGKDIVKSFTPKGEDNFQRPKTETNIGRGIKQFVKLETIKNEGYLNNNEIFIKVEVEPFDLSANK